MCGEFYPGWFDSWASSTTAAARRRPLPSSTACSRRTSPSARTWRMAAPALASGPARIVRHFVRKPAATITMRRSTRPLDHAEIRCNAPGDDEYLAPGEKLPDVPPRNPVIAVPAFSLAQAAPIFANLPAPAATHDEHPRTMEAVRPGLRLYSLSHETSARACRAARFRRASRPTA